MELQQDSIIVSDRLQGIFDFELRNHFTHVFVTDGECVMNIVESGLGDETLHRPVGTGRLPQKS